MGTPRLVALLGKGGTGKTTLTSLFLKCVLEKNGAPVLAIDADPNSCLPDLLGVRAEKTVGSIKRDLLDRREQLAAASVSKAEYCEFALENAIVESIGFDLVVMGRPDGDGCYCFVNSVVQTMIGRLKKNYGLVIADCEAGLEHLSRRTLGEIDVAFIVSDLSRKGVATAVRQVALMAEVRMVARQVFLLINGLNSDRLPTNMVAIIEQAGLPLAGTVRHDALVEEFERSGRSLLELPPTAVSYADVRKIVDRLL
jgi:CO dehydrogenase maturation factor